LVVIPEGNLLLPLSLRLPLPLPFLLSSVLSVVEGRESAVVVAVAVALAFLVVILEGDLLLCLRRRN